MSSFKYLGNWVTYNLAEQFEINKKLGSFYGDVNHLHAVFKHVETKTMSVLFNSHCCHFYGSQAWSLMDSSVNKVYIAWNKAVRHLCKLPYNTHTKFLPYVMGTLPVKE